METLQQALVQKLQPELLASSEVDVMETLNPKSLILPILPLLASSEVDVMETLSTLGFLRPQILLLLASSEVDVMETISNPLLFLPFLHF